MWLKELIYFKQYFAWWKKLQISRKFSLSFGVNVALRTCGCHVLLELFGGKRQLIAGHAKRSLYPGLAATGGDRRALDLVRP